MGADACGELLTGSSRLFPGQYVGPQPICLGHELVNTGDREDVAGCGLPPPTRRRATYVAGSAAAGARPRLDRSGRRRTAGRQLPVAACRAKSPEWRTPGGGESAAIRRWTRGFTHPAER